MPMFIIGSPGPHVLNPDVLLFVSPSTGGFADLSYYGLTPTVDGAKAVLDAGLIKIIDGTAFAFSYPNTSCAGHNTASYTWEYFVSQPSPVAVAGSDILTTIQCVNGEHRHTKGNSAPPDASTQAWLDSTPKIVFGTQSPNVLVHLCHMYRGSDDGTEGSFTFINGVAGGTEVNNNFNLNPTLGGAIGFSAAIHVSGNRYFGQIRLKLGLQYSTAGFTPPANGDLDPYL